jgi:hypothetical protein
MDYNKENYIVLDCEPGYPRPNDILTTVLRDTELTNDDFSITLKCFGAWTFNINNNKVEEFHKYFDIIGKAITSAEIHGRIRYGEWIKNI